MVPPDASVLAQNRIFPHVCSRLDAYVWLPPGVTVDYLIVDVTYWDFTASAPRYVVGPKSFDEQFRSLLESEQYGVLANADGILLLRRGIAGEPKLYKPFVRVFTYKELTSSGNLVQDSGSSSGSAIQLRPGSGSDKMSWYGPYTVLPMGTFNAIFRFSGRTIETNRAMNATDLPGATWVNVELSFPVREPRTFEFRGRVVGGQSVILLDLIRIVQTSADTSLHDTGLLGAEVTITTCADAHPGKSIQTSSRTSGQSSQYRKGTWPS